MIRPRYGSPLLRCTFIAVAAALLSAGCPVETSLPGDVIFGEFVIEATVGEDECGSTEEAGDFSFRARVAADIDAKTAWLSLANPPEAQLQGARAGRIVDGSLIFEGEQAFPDNCGCGVLAKEVITLVFVVEEETENVDETDNGDVDETEPVNGNGDGNGNGNGDEDLVPPIEGLPHPQEVTGITGSIDYEFSELTDCGITVEECTLPCTFDYLLEGDKN